MIGHKNRYLICYDTHTQYTAFELFRFSNLFGKKKAGAIADNFLASAQDSSDTIRSTPPELVWAHSRPSKGRRRKKKGSATKTIFKVSEYIINAVVRWIRYNQLPIRNEINLIEWKTGWGNPNGTTVLTYNDSRCVRLDSVATKDTCCSVLCLAIMGNLVGSSEERQLSV